MPHSPRRSPEPQPSWSGTSATASGASEARLLRGVLGGRFAGRRPAGPSRRGGLSRTGGLGLPGEGRIGEDDPVAAEHVVGVELGHRAGSGPRGGWPKLAVGDAVLGRRGRRAPGPRARGRPGRPRRPWSSAPSNAHSSIRAIRPSAARSDRAECSARRIIFLGVRWRYERGLGPRAMPPPTHCGERVEPCRARPVPFCRKGFAPPPAPRPGSWWTGCRPGPTANCAVTTWWSTAVLGSMPKISGARTTSI